jgi:hypothetical protein
LRKVNYILIVISFLSFFCDSRKENPIYLAKVNDNYLSLNDLKTRFDTNSIRSKSKVQEYINQWITQNILYTEAEEKGITKTQEFNDLLEEAKKSIAVNLLLEKEIYSKTIDISPIEITDYYNNHKDEFILGNDMINISYIVFVNLEKAKDFKESITAENWKDRIYQLRQASSVKEILSESDSVFYKSFELSSPDIWKSAIGMHNDEISKPIRSLDGYVVFKLNSFQRAGEIGGINFAKSEIKERILIDKRKKIYSGFLYDLQKKYRPEFLNESINK